MPSLIRNEKVNWDSFGTQTTPAYLACHKKRCSVGSHTFSSCTNFSTKSRVEKIYHIAKKHIVHKCNLSDKDFHSFYNLREHKWKEIGAQRSSGARTVDVAHVMGDVDDKGLKEELKTFKHFLVDSEMENGLQKVYNSAMDTLDPKYQLDKLDFVFHSLKYAAKLNVAFGFKLKNVEDGSCRYYNACKIIKLLKRSKSVTTKDLTKVKRLLNNTDIICSCTGERANTIWKFYQLTKVTIFAAILKEVPRGCKDTVLPDPLSKNFSVKC